MRLVFGDELPQSIVLLLHLVERRAARRTGVTCQLFRQAQGVVAGVNSLHGAIDTQAQGCDRIGSQPAQHIVRVRMGRAVAVGPGAGAAWLWTVAPLGLGKPTGRRTGPGG